jgi:transposase, IS605 OrfB family, central region
LIRAKNLRLGTADIVEQRIIRKAGKWFCHLIIDDPISITSDSPRSAVGIDVGLAKFATMSDGTTIENPRFGKKAERKLAHAHRNVSRTKKGSKNRRKMVERLQRVYLRIHNLRHNFTHQESRRTANKYGVIAVEDLNVKGMVRSRYGKSILDACWSMFTTQLTYKAEEAGGMVVRVNPAGTSQECSQCGQSIPKDLSVRVHRCDCGCVLDRDLNAARNILRRALDQHRPAVGGIVTPVEGTAASLMNQEEVTIKIGSHHYPCCRSSSQALTNQTDSAQ